MKYHLAQTTSAFLVMASLVPCATAADKHFMSVPRDTQIYPRPAIPDDFRPLTAPKALAGFVASMLVVDAVVNNADPALKNDDTVGFRGELSIGAAVRSDEDEGPAFARRRIVLTDFEESWGVTAPLWLSTDEGQIWTKEFTINPPPGDPGAIGCPCDQTVDFNPLTGTLAGTFLTNDSCASVQALPLRR